MANVELNHVTKRFGSFTATRDLSLTIDDGSFCALLGPSGCGKSTLLRMISGLETVSEGEIRIGGVNVTDVHPAKREIAMVFQSYALYPHLTVAENIGFSLTVAGEKKPAIAQRVAEIAKLLQLEELLARKPGQLSGGQRQRVAIGRSLVRDPKAFLFDEPLSNLDAMLRVQMRLELAKLHQDIKTTMIYVTHDQVEAMTLADKVVVMDRGEISQVGAPMDLYNRPQNKFVASFIGSPAMNFIPIDITGSENDRAIGRFGSGATIPLVRSTALSQRALSSFEIGIRPEHIQLCSPDSASATMTGRILLVERLGSATVFHVDTPAGMIVAQAWGENAAVNGELVGLAFDNARVVLFDPAGKAIYKDRLQ